MGDRSTNGESRDEYPSDTWYRLTSPETTLFEEPLVIGVELLEGIVRKDASTGPVGDLQHEGVTPTDRARRRCEDLARQDRFLVELTLRRIDPMCKGCINNDDDVVVVELVGERPHGLIELCERWDRAALGCDVRSVDDEM